MAREALSNEVTFGLKPDEKQPALQTIGGECLRQGAQQVKDDVDGPALFDGWKDCQCLWSTADMGKKTTGGI